MNQILNLMKVSSLISDRYYQISKYATDTSNSIRSNITKNTTEKLNNII